MSFRASSDSVWVYVFLCVILRVAARLSICTHIQFSYRIPLKKGSIWQPPLKHRPRFINYAKCLIMKSCPNRKHPLRSPDSHTSDGGGGHRDMMQTVFWHNLCVACLCVMRTLSCILTEIAPSNVLTLIIYSASHHRSQSQKHNISVLIELLMRGAGRNHRTWYRMHWLSLVVRTFKIHNHNWNWSRYKPRHKQQIRNITTHT